MSLPYRMIDVGAKPVTHRIAIAEGRFSTSPEAFERIINKTLPKGDVLSACQIAGIQGAKRAHDTIIFCHPLGLDHVEIIPEPEPETHSVRVTCIAAAHAKTGVEMEALAGVNAALLTLWDLTKMVEPALLMSDIRLLAKRGGKSGVWLHPEGVSDEVRNLIDPPAPQVLSGRRVAVVTLSDRAHAGVYEDASGEAIKDILSAHGADITDYRLIPDEPATLSATVTDLAHSRKPHLIVCTGGTGVAPRDVTPDTLTPLFDRSIEGIGELLRSDGAKYTPLSWSSRAVGGQIGESLIVTLPGSPRAVKEGLSALLPELIPHLIRIMNGEGK